MNNYQTNLMLAFCLVLLFFGIPLKVKITNNIDEEFRAYLQKFNKSYNDTEYSKRLQIFQNSMETIRKLNDVRNSSNSAQFGLTKYSDLSPFEFLLGKILKEKGEKPDYKEWLKFQKKSRPLRIDWRDKNVVSTINNQGACGACWAYTTIETLESLNAIKTKTLDRLSVQQLLDCSKENYGCNGGDMCALLKELTRNGTKIYKDSDYPLTHRVDECKARNSTGEVGIKSYKCEYLGNHEEIILDYLANIGPVSAAVNAGVWQHYLGGIIQYHCEESPFFINHAVQIVGYDISGSIPYYIVRNSWGPDFGEKGYLRIVIGKNMCGIGNKIVSIHL